jgi:hypothetical protein
VLVGCELGDSLSLEPHHLSVGGAGRDVDLRRAIERLDLRVGSQHGLGEPRAYLRNREVHVREDVEAVALEVRVRFHRHLDDQVSRRAARAAVVALASIDPTLPCTLKFCPLLIPFGMVIVSLL